MDRTQAPRSQRRAPLRKAPGMGPGSTRWSRIGARIPERSKAAPRSWPSEDRVNGRADIQPRFVIGDGDDDDKVVEIDPALHERGSRWPQRGRGCGGCAGVNETGRPSGKSVSATCAVTKRPRGPLVGHLVDTFTTKSVLSRIPPCATSGPSRDVEEALRRRCGRNGVGRSKPQQ
jgi:hypothetical protein